MEADDYLICVECESYCYTFEIKSGEIVEALCEVCGNEETTQFLNQEDYDALIGG